MTIPEAAHIQLRRGPPEDEQGNARNMQRSLINVLYVKKQEFGASSWRSNQGYTKMHGQPTIKYYRMLKKKYLIIGAFTLRIHLTSQAQN